METSSDAVLSFLRAIPLFSLLEPEDGQELLRLLRPVNLEAGQVLFRQGDKGDALWVLGDGVEVSISHKAPDAKRPVVVAYARSGETIGEMALVDDGGRSGTAVVMSGGPAHRIDAIDFHTLRAAFSPVAFRILRRIAHDLCSRLRATTERIVPSSRRVLDAPDLTGRGRPDPALLDLFQPFQPLPEVVKLALAQKLQLVEVPGVLPLFGEGEEGDAAWFILSGGVDVGRNGTTFAQLGPGQMFGLVSLIDGGRRSASCITTGPAQLLRLQRTDFDHLFQAGNRFAFELVDLVCRQLVGHLRSANDRLPQPGQAAPPARPLPVPSAAAARLLDADVLPLELEMDLEVL